MKKILIVDDDAELRAKLSEILKEAGYLTDEAASGKGLKGRVPTNSILRSI